jgi:hypothetical protein
MEKCRSTGLPAQTTLSIYQESNKPNTLKLSINARIYSVESLKKILKLHMCFVYMYVINMLELDIRLKLLFRTETLAHYKLFC